MVLSTPANLCAIFEVLVVLFQVCGIMGLCLNRLMPRSTPWCSRGQIGSIIALFGLGIAGALCGRHDSEFALLRRWNDDGPADRSDDREWNDRQERAGATECDDRSRTRCLKKKKST